MPHYSSDATKNKKADGMARDLDNGYCRIYSGTEPASANAALAGNTLLAELRFAATSAPAASAGVLTFNPITADSSADASGTASFYRTFKSDGTSVVTQGTCGTSGQQMNLATLTISAGIQVQISSFTHTEL